MIEFLPLSHLSHTLFPTATLVVHYMFRHIFEGLESRYAEELAVIREQYPSEPVQFTEKPLIIHWAEGMQMLRQAGHQVETIFVFFFVVVY